MTQFDQALRPEWQSPRPRGVIVIRTRSVVGLPPARSSGSATHLRALPGKGAAPGGRREMGTAGERVADRSPGVSAPC